MVILGLGSNLNDRLASLRRALRLLRTIPHFRICQVSPVYISDALLPENAPTTWDMPYFNLALRCETTLTPYELLEHTKRIEIEVGRKPEKNWGPRVIDIDLLAWDDFIQYDEKLHIPHENLHERPFALWPLADVAPRWVYPLPGPHHGKTAAEMVLEWGSRFSGEAPFHTKQIQQRIDTPELVGIINLTPDSFSDGGKFPDAVAATQYAQYVVEAGAEILDIGAESTGPHASPLNAEAEWSRLEPFLTTLLSGINNLIIRPKISIDTYHPEVAQKALDYGVDWINDVSGLDHPAMRQLMANQTCDVIVMHHLSIPENRDHVLAPSDNAIDVVYQWAEKRLSELEKEGISRNRIIFDVGIGFGKTPEQSLALIQNISVFRDLNTRLMVGHSRKSFLKQFTTKSPLERDIETMVLSLYLAEQNIDYLRVHDVEGHARAFKIKGCLNKTESW